MIGLIVIDTYRNATLDSDYRIRNAPTDMKFHHLSATNASPLIYIYYQLNESAIAEISYDITTDKWASDSVGISIL